jgi:hypothetical protein
VKAVEEVRVFLVATFRCDCNNQANVNSPKQDGATALPIPRVLCMKCEGYPEMALESIREIVPNRIVKPTLVMPDGAVRGAQ